MARILLIEDNDPVRALLRENLELEGHAVIEARDGQEGLDLFRQAGADLDIRRRAGLHRHGRAPRRGEGAPQAVSDRGAAGSDQRAAAGRSLGVVGPLEHRRLGTPIPASVQGLERLCALWSRKT